MPIPKYVKKSKHKEYRRKHRKIAKEVTGKVRSPYAVAAKRLEKQYKTSGNSEVKPKSKKK